MFYIGDICCDTDRRYFGNRCVIDNAKCLSKYAKKKLAVTYGCGFVKIIEDFGDKVKVDIYYLDINIGYCHPANYISTDIVDKSDIKILDWNLAVQLYREHDARTVIPSYLEYLELYSIDVEGSISSTDKLWTVRKYNTISDSDKLVSFNSFGEYLDKVSDWMIEQVESGNVNIDEVIKNLNANYHI